MCYPRHLTEVSVPEGAGISALGDLEQQEHHLSQALFLPEASYLLEAQASWAAFGHAELPHTHHSAGPRGDDDLGGWAHSTQAAAPGGQILEHHQDLWETRGMHTDADATGPGTE